MNYESFNPVGLNVRGLRPHGFASPQAGADKKTADEAVGIFEGTSERDFGRGQD